MSESALGKCRTEDCDQAAEYAFAPGKLCVCHDCLLRLKELFAEIEEDEDLEADEDDEE